MQEHVIEMFYDGDCAICNSEARLLERLDRKQRIRLTNIASPDFDATRTGISWQQLMDRIHARLPDGRIIEGVEVFRMLYTAVGFGWLVRITRLPLVAPLLDMAYDTFARNRLRLTGRCTDESCPSQRRV
jgi:predicted DCC family thiol-disulfide oxidoreductase YuxK